MGFLILDGSGPGVRAALSGLGAREATRAGELAGQVQALLAAHGLAPAALSAIVGIVDSVDVLGKQIFSGKA